MNKFGALRFTQEQNKHQASIFEPDGYYYFTTTSTQEEKRRHNDRKIGDWPAKNI